MFEDDDLDLDFGDSLLEPMTMLKSNPTFKPKLPSSSVSRASNPPYPPCPPRKPPPAQTPQSKLSITQMTAPSNPSSVQPSHPKFTFSNQAFTSSPIPITPPMPSYSTPAHLPPSVPPVSKAQASLPLPPLVRRFPGPAGLMPKLSPGVHKAADEDDDREERREQDEDSMDCEGVVDCVAWKRAMQELGMIDKGSLVERFNTSWIKNKSQAGTTKKMPFFLCKIGKLDLTSVDPLVMLVDRDGKVEGSMHRDVVEQLGKEVRVGSVLVLQSVAVLVTARKEYVNITLNNLVSIYSKTSVKYVKRVSKEDMLVVARELDRVREQQMRSIMGGDSQPSPSPPPQSFPPAWSTPQMRPTVTSRAPLSPMNRPSLNQPNFQPFSPQQPTIPPPSNNFTFKSHNPRLPSFPPPTSQIPSQAQAQSQVLVNSLMSDLDTSDIFSDF